MNSPQQQKEIDKYIKMYNHLSDKQLKQMLKEVGGTDRDRLRKKAIIALLA